jgi:hypothetical protein
VQAPAFIFVQRTDKDRTVNAEVYVKNFFQFKIIFFLYNRIFLDKGLILLKLRRFDKIRFFEAEKFSKFLHVQFFIDNCNFFHVSMDSLLQYSVLFKQLALIINF